MTTLLPSQHCIAFGVPFQLAADSSPLLAAMLHCAPFSTQPGIAGSADARQFTLVRHPAGTGHRLSSDNEIFAEDTDLRPLLDRLTRDLMTHVANHAPDRVFVHAGVVGWHGRALLLPGASFAGKTTLVAALVRAGAVYYSDEYAVLDGHGRVHPYPRPLQVRISGGPQQTPVTVESFNGHAGAGAIPASHVVFTEYAASGQWAPQPLSPGMAALEMLRHTIPVQRTPARVMATLARMMESASALRSPRGEASEAAALLLAAMGPAAANPMVHARAPA